MRTRSIALIAFILGCFTYAGMHLLLPNPCFTLTFANSFTAHEKLDAYLGQAGVLAPILIVDASVLIAISTNSPLLFTKPVKVAIERSFEHHKVAEHEELLEIIYYEKSNDTDYWLFTDKNGTERAMLPFNITAAKMYSYPTRIDHFIQDWSYSRMLKCAGVLNRPANVTRKIPLSFTKHFADLRDFIKTKDNAHLVTHCGTLLGWYRECSIIPHTTDVDFFIRSEEYSPKILTALNDKKSPYRLFRIYGVPDDSYELAVTVKKTERITEICTGDLLGNLIYIPCNVEDVLKAEYGDWKKDKSSSSYVWYKSSKNVSPNGVFTKAQMKKMRRGD